MTSSYYFFWNGPLSQWHPCRFHVQSQKYNCAEQYMMHRKALLFHDVNIAESIIKSSNPSKQKALGKKVRGFSNSIWNKHRENIVFEGNLAKFTQNKGLRRKLFQTGDALLVEASPIDTTWGIGLNEEKAKTIPPTQWHGLNLLGKCLTMVRKQLKTQFSTEAKSVQISDAIWNFDESRI